MGLEDEVGQRAMEAADKSKTEGTTMVLTAAPDPPQTWGVKGASETNNQWPIRNAGIVVRKAIVRASLKEARQHG